MDTGHIEGGNGMHGNGYKEGFLSKVNQVPTLLQMCLFSFFLFGNFMYRILFAVITMYLARGHSSISTTTFPLWCAIFRRADIHPIIEANGGEPRFNAN